MQGNQIILIPNKRYIRYDSNRIREEHKLISFFGEILFDVDKSRRNIHQTTSLILGIVKEKTLLKEKSS